MSGKAGRISLFITLGIAAIDMLTCAFVSALMLCLLFLIPEHAGAGARDSQDILLLHWSASSATRAVIGIKLERNGQSSTIWSDELQIVDEVCNNLSRTPNSREACFLLNAGSDPYNQDSVLIILRPLAGQWSITIAYADTSDYGNGGNYAPVDLQVNLVRDSAIDLIAKLAPGNQVDLATLDQKETAAVRKLLKVERMD